MELSKFNLVFIDYENFTTQVGFVERQWNILLMQELRNAVASDFEVSDYFLTVNAVGTVINGDHATFNAPFQSGASNYGSINQHISVGEIADKVSNTLGSDILQRDHELAAAIQDLRISLESERQSKIGRVISQLGRSLEHSANTYTIIQGLGFLTQIL